MYCGVSWFSLYLGTKLLSFWFSLFVRNQKHFMDEKELGGNIRVREMSSSVNLSYLPRSPPIQFLPRIQSPSNGVGSMGNYGHLESSYFPQTMASPRVQSLSRDQDLSQMDQNLDRFHTGRESLSVTRNVSNLGFSSGVHFWLNWMGNPVRVRSTSCEVLTKSVTPTRPAQALRGDIHLVALSCPTHAGYVILVTTH